MALTHQPVTTSGFIAAGTTVVVAGKGALGNNSAAPGAHCHAVQLLSDGSNAATIIVYNSSAATAGTEVAALAVAATTAAPQYITFDNPVVCERGITIVVAGTGARAIISYSLGN